MSVYGFFPQHFATAAEAGRWTFALEDMAKFGLEDITYEGSDPYPTDAARALLGLSLVEVDDR